MLVRYNPESDEAMNRRQAARLRDVADYVHKSGQHFMFELLVPMTHEQSDRLEGDQHLYDHDLRPSLMMAAIKELQNAGVEPDVWKIEGLDRTEDCRNVVTAARRAGRDKVGCIVLGRHEDDARVRQWLTTAAAIKSQACRARRASSRRLPGSFTRRRRSPASNSTRRQSRGQPRVSMLRVLP